jgi:hypothetical protein
MNTTLESLIHDLQNIVEQVEKRNIQLAKCIVEAKHLLNQDTSIKFNVNKIEPDYVKMI